LRSTYPDACCLVLVNTYQTVFVRSFIPFGQSAPTSMAKPRLHNCTDQHWWFEVEDGEVNANIAGIVIDYRIDVVQVDKWTKDDTVAIQVSMRF